jgi:hypothetical protein
MAELKKIRIQNKFDTYTNWMSSDKPLLAGEIAICLIPGQTSASGLTPPAVGIKVGEDGVKTFSQLPWIQATAGDVSLWAKRANLTYADLTDDFKQALAQDTVFAQYTDTDTTYSFTFANDKLVVRGFSKGEEGEGSLVAELPIAISTKIDKVTGAAGKLAQFKEDGNIESTNVVVADLETKANAEATYATKTSVSTLETNLGKTNEDVAANAEDIEALQGDVQTLTSGKANKVTGAVAGNVASLSAEGDLVDGGVAVSALAKSADVTETLKLYQTVEAHNTYAADVASKFTKVNEDIATNAGDIKDLQDAIDGLIDDNQGSIQDMIDASINDFATKISDDQTVNTFKELVDWAGEHNAEAVGAIVKDIAENQKDIAALETKMGEAEAAIAKKAEQTALEAEAKSREDADKAESEARVAADEALAGRAAALEATVNSNEGKTGLVDVVAAHTSAISQLQTDAGNFHHVHNNKTVIDGISAEKVAAWDQVITDLATEVSDRKAADGDLTSLTTEAKTNLVAAINEVKAGVGANAGAISTNAGAISQLQTEVGAIQESAITKISGVTTTGTTEVTVTAVPTNLLVDAEEVLVLYCGTASEVF